MVNTTVALFQVHASRSRAAFEALVERWAGILVSDSYGVYQHWVYGRQTCLAHLIRRVQGLAERTDPGVARFGQHMRDELQRLVHWAKAPPTCGEVKAWYAQVAHLLMRHWDRRDDAGKFARALDREMEHLWTFLVEEGVDPTNNQVLMQSRFEGFQAFKESEHHMPHTQRGPLPLFSWYPESFWQGCGVKHVAHDAVSFCLVSLISTRKRMAWHQQRSCCKKSVERKNQGSFHPIFLRFTNGVL
jgi:hypothetical protein